MTIGYYLDPTFLAHDPGWGHPERAARIVAVDEALSHDGFADVDLRRLPSAPATTADLCRVHPLGYLTAMRRLCEEGGGSLDADTTVSEKSFDAAARAAGSGLDAVARVRAGEIDGAFVAARPPGHHARPHSAMGFCIVNNIAVVAAHLADHGERVAIVDWDAHHGNGTQEIFWRDPRVLFISLHQYPFYPFSGSAREVGEGAGEGYTLNLPMPAGSGADDYGYAFDRAVLPALEEFGPQWVLVSAGFDAHRNDPLCDLALDEKAYRAMASALGSVGPPIVSFLEGGYDLAALGSSSRAVLEVWSGDDAGPAAAGSGVSERVVAAIDTALEARQAALS